MRKSTYRRTVVVAAAIAVSPLVHTQLSHAAVNDEDHRSGAQSSLFWATRQSVRLPSTGRIGGSALGIQISANMDPVADPSKSTLAVDMPRGVIVEARWSDANKIDLVVVDDGTESAVFKSEYTIAPHVTLFIDILGSNLEYDYSASALLAAIPGSAWTYRAIGAKAFAPWGFVPTTLKVPAPSLDSARLFSIPIPQIAGSRPIGGQLALNATTDPTFVYRTQEVVLNNGGAITEKEGSYGIPTVDADFIDVPAKVRGTISYSGTFLVRPSVTITSVAGFTIPGSLVIDASEAGVTIPFSSGATPLDVRFPDTTFHIPLPNVKVTHSELDLGKVDVQRSETRKVEVRNTGEMRAALTFASSDPQFVVTTRKEFIASKDRYELEVTFKPTSEGPQSATIRVMSNDPNEPVQTIKVAGAGVAGDIGQSTSPTTPSEPGDTTGSSTSSGAGGEGDTGCGCRTASSSSHNAAGWAASLIALGAVLARRSRRSRAR